MHKIEVIMLINTASDDILKTALGLDLDLSSESESESEEVLNVIIPTQVSRLRGKRKKIIRIEGYVENVVPRFSARQFKEHFRMTPNCFYLLENKLSPILVNLNSTGRPCVPPRVQLLAVLWLLATPDSYR